MVPSRQSSIGSHMPTRASPVMVVGIGASAGGLKALQQFVEAVPRESDMAFVVILHLDPERESRMPRLLQDRSAIPVTQVTGATEIEANHVYLIPPGEDLTLNETTLQLRPRGERADHAPVDLFFRTLAETCGADAGAVVLSGTGTDGTAGIRYIREAGGVTIAQSPEEAEYDGMPTSAIATGLVDLVLPSSRIPGELVRLRRLPSRTPAETPTAAETETALAEVFATLRSRTGHDFALYKRSTILRRLDRRLRFHDVSTLRDYVPVLQASQAECEALLRDLLISVSSFFRDPEAFEALVEQVPALFEGKGRSDAVRVWVVGCATGEEVYSIAMVLAEHASTLKDPARVQIFATDIDDRGYAWGRAGLYSAAAIVNVSPERVRRFFTKEAGGYRISKSLREGVLFARHNVLHDPPFSRIDLISCRNLFIYLQPAAQERVLETFHFSFNPGGVLLLGASESVGDSRLFVPVSENAQRIYRRSRVPHRVIPRVSAPDPTPGSRRTASSDDGNEYEGDRPFSYGALHVGMLEQYAPASLVVNDRNAVVHLSAAAGRFLRLGEGRPSHDVLDLAPAELRTALRTALHHAFRNGSAATRRVYMDVDGSSRPIVLHVRPSRGELEGGRFALVLFESESHKAAGVPADGDTDETSSGAAIELELELRRAMEQLESMSAEHDRTVAELQTANEELLSINEEQKAAGEELETGREEIQSINEELTTINQEYHSTIEELRQTNADLQNLIESTDIGTIFLDRAMRIRRFTPAVEPLFNFVDADRGRPLSDITHRLDYDGLLDDVSGVLRSLNRVEREVSSRTGESYILRINPYRSQGGEFDGVVLTFFDNTAQHHIHEQLREANAAADAANRSKGAFLSTLSHEFRTSLNSVLGYADLLQLDGRLDAAQNVKVERIKAGGRHLVAMIEAILSFAKLDAGQEVVRNEHLDAKEVARDAATLIEPTAGSKGLSLSVDGPDRPVSFVTDGVKVRQVLINLCSNAVKYTDSGHVTLRVREDGETVVFEVHDTGIGIADEHIARIFERFWQVDGRASRSGGGMGIGLAAAREYARLLGGDVEVESEPGVGSTFRLWLPKTPRDG